MPALETVAFHAGYGVPLWMVTSSGRTPLVKAIPGMLDELCETNEGAEIGRIVVIDAEGNSVPFLEGLEQRSPKRGWVTRLRPSLIEGKTVFERSRYRGYRDGDRVRVGLADLHDPASPETPFRIRVVEIERRSKGTSTYLGASTLLDKREWGASAIADLYFERWPKQEANFRAVNQALGLKEVHGYGKQLVDNISVVTRLDELAQKIPHEQQQLALLAEQHRSDQQRLEQQRKSLTETERRHAVLERQLHARLSKGKLITPQLQQFAANEKETAKQIRSHEDTPFIHAQLFALHRPFLERCIALNRLDGEPPPPWVAFPNADPFRGFRQGTNEYWMQQAWGPFWFNLASSERESYLQRHAAPPAWRERLALHPRL